MEDNVEKNPILSTKIIPIFTSPIPLKTSPKEHVSRIVQVMMLELTQSLAFSVLFLQTATLILIMSCTKTMELELMEVLPTQLLETCLDMTAI